MEKINFDVARMYELIAQAGGRFAWLSYEDGEWVVFADRGEWREEMEIYCEAGCCGHYKADNPVTALEQLIADESIKDRI